MNSTKAALNNAELLLLLLVKIYLCVIITSREILDEWLRQLSPHCLEFERKAVHNRCERSYFILQAKITYKLK